MAEQMELGDILDGKEPEKQEQEEKQEPVKEEGSGGSVRKRAQEREREAREAGDGKVRDPNTGQFVPKEEKKEEVKEPPKEAPKEAPKEEFTAKERAFLTAAQQEREKRQALEAKLAEYQSKEPKPETPKFWDDPEGNLQRFEQNMQHVLVKHKLDTSEAIARTRHTDFDEKGAVFAELAKTVPGLFQQMVSNVDPAEFAYQQAKSYMEIKQAGNMDEVRKKIEAETRIKLEAEYKKKYEDMEKERASIPGSLSDVRGANANNRAWVGPTSLESILGDK